MAYLDFFTGFATTGRIFGAGVGTRPEDWPPLLGEEFFDASWNPRRRVLQFGFVDMPAGYGTAYHPTLGDHGRKAGRAPLS